MELEYYLITAIILILAYVIRGITGFGSGLIAIPLLALFQPLTFVVPFILLLDFTASLVLGGLSLKQVKWREIFWLIPFSLIGVVVGTKLLIEMPAAPMLIALSLFIFVFAIRSLLKLKDEKNISQKWAIPTALIGGSIAGSFGTGGPPYVIYLTHRIHDKGQLRATLSALFFMEGLLRIISFFVIGLLLSQFIWWTALMALPVMLLSLYAGSRIHVGLTQPQMTQFIGILLLLASITLLVKAIFYT